MSKTDFMAKYGHVKVKFGYYYKYRFSFEGPCDNGDMIYVDIGGDGDDIYRREVSSDEISINSLCPDHGYVYRGKDLIDCFGE